MPYKDINKARQVRNDWGKKQRSQMTAEQKKEFYKTRYEKDRDKYKIRRDNLHLKVIEKLGGKCSNPCCAWINEDGSRGCADIRCLQVDHKFGGGNKERKEIGSSYYNKVLKNTQNLYQLLCADCNWIKRVLNGEHA